MTATEAEELAKKIIRAEWAIIKGWVPEIVANEVAGQLCEAIRPILSEQAQQLAALRAELARLTAEVEAMENQHADECMAMMAQRQYDEVQFAEQAKQLAVTTERLAAADRLVEAYRHYGDVQVTGDSVYIKENGRSGSSPHAELFDALRDFAQGWLPAGVAKGGGG